MIALVSQREKTRIQPAVRVVDGSVLLRREGDPPQLGQLPGQNLLRGVVLPGQT